MHRGNAMNRSSGLKPVQPRTNWFLVIGSILILCLFLVFGLAAYSGHRADVAIAEARAETDLLEPNGWSVADLQAQRPPLADEDNAALMLDDILATVPKQWRGYSYTFDERLRLPANVQLDPILLKELQEALALTEPAGQLADKLADKSRGRFADDPTFGPWSITPSAPCYELSNFLRLRSITQAQTGDPDTALRTVRAMLVLCQCMNGDPKCVWVYRHRIQDNSAESLEKILGQGQPSEAAMAQAQRAFEQEADEILLVEDVRGLRAFEDLEMRLVLSGKMPVDNLFYSGCGHYYLEGEEPRRTFRESVEVRAVLRRVRSEYADWLRTANDLVSVAKLPSEEQRAGYTAALQAAAGRSPGSRLGKAWMSDVQRVFNKA
jgi:hypothetical protein